MPFLLLQKSPKKTQKPSRTTAFLSRTTVISARGRSLPRLRAPHRSARLSRNKGLSGSFFRAENAYNAFSLPLRPSSPKNCSFLCGNGRERPKFRSVPAVIVRDRPLLFSPLWWCVWPWQRSAKLPRPHLHHGGSLQKQDGFDYKGQDLAQFCKPFPVVCFVWAFPVEKSHFSVCETPWAVLSGSRVIPRRQDFSGPGKTRKGA